MAALRSCLCSLVSFAVLRSSATSPIEPGCAGCDARDNVLLVQRGLTARQGDLASGEEEALASSPSQEAVLSKVRDAVRQMPFELPANVSMEDLMVMGQKILGTFKSESFVADIHEGIDNMTEAWAVYLNGFEADQTKLDANCTGETTDDTIDGLESYFRAHEGRLSRFTAEMVNGGLRMMERHPNETRTIMEAVAPFMNGTAPGSMRMDPAMLSGKLSNMTGVDLTLLTADSLFSNKSKVCSKFQSVWANISALEVMWEKGSAFLQDASKMLVDMEGLIVALAPDVGDRVMGVMNASMKAALNVTTSAVPVTQASNKALKAELEQCLSCKMPVPEEGGSMRVGPNVVVSLALAMAAWLAFRG